MSNKIPFKKSQKSKLKITSRSYYPNKKLNKSFHSNDSYYINSVLGYYSHYEKPKPKNYYYRIKKTNKESYNIKNMKNVQEYKDKGKSLKKEIVKTEEKEEITENEKENEKEEDNDNKNYKYTFEYLIQFETWEAANQTDLLTESIINHINEMEGKLKQMDKKEKKEKKYIKSKSNNSICNTSISSTSSIINVSLETWGRKDYTKEIKVAEENKKKLQEFDEKDAIKKELRAILNRLTKDNYELLKDEILEIIKDKIENQEKFLDIFFIKAIKEKSYSEIYAKLCKYLNKVLPQKNPSKKEKGKSTSSIFREQLLAKCRDILKKTNYDEYIKEDDPEERIIKLKKFILGNVNFLTELVKIKMLAKKVIPECINYLFDRYEKDKDKTLKLIHVEAIILFTDKFGALIHSENTSKKPEEGNLYKTKIDEIFKKLEKIKEDKEIPGYIRYLIINLIEKKKNNYEESQFEKFMKAKSKQELEDELNKKEEKKGKEEKEEKEENEEEKIKLEIYEKMKKDLNEYKDFIQEEGSSDNYNWETTTILYEVKFRSFDDILEGYIISSGDFIEQESNIKYAKNYIKELIEYYHKNLNGTELDSLKKRIFDLFAIVTDIAFETPKIYDIYAYVIYILIENKVIEKEDVENIFKEKSKKGDISLDICNKIEESINGYLKMKIMDLKEKN